MLAGNEFGTTEEAALAPVAPKLPMPYANADNPSAKAIMDATTSLACRDLDTGKIMRTKHMKSHFRRRKSPRVKRMFDRMYPLDSSQEKNIKRLLPYGID